LTFAGKTGILLHSLRGIRGSWTMDAAIQIAVAKSQEKSAMHSDGAAMEAIQRLAGSAKYAPPKVISFPIDALRLTGPISLAGNI
jgi:hypothetical protein